MQDFSVEFDHFSRRSLQQIVAAINAGSRKSARSHRRLAIAYAARAASVIARE